MTRIHRIRLRLSNAFLVIGERPVLVDTGSPGEASKVIQQMSRHGVSAQDLSLILLTHAHTDHAGNAAELQKLTDAPVAIHPAETAMLSRGTMGKLKPLRPRHKLLELYVNKPFNGLTADQELSDGQRLDSYGLAAAVCHTPGHTAGSVSVVLDPPSPGAANDALMGDLLIGGFLGGLIHPGYPRLPYFAEDYSQIERSLHRVLPRIEGRLHLGHGGPIHVARARDRLLETAVEESAPPQLAADAIAREYCSNGGS